MGRVWGGGEGEFGEVVRETSGPADESSKHRLALSLLSLSPLYLSLSFLSFSPISLSSSITHSHPFLFSFNSSPSIIPPSSLSSSFPSPPSPLPLLLICCH